MPNAASHGKELHSVTHIYCFSLASLFSINVDASHHYFFRHITNTALFIATLPYLTLHT